MMFKKTFVTLGLMSLVTSGLLACGCSQGCTPGFWKTGNKAATEVDSSFQTETYVGAFQLVGTAALQVNAMVNDVNVKKAYLKLPGMTEDDVLELGEALWLEGNKGKKGEDKFLQLVRTSTAAMLNIRHLDYYYYDTDWGGWMDEATLRGLVQDAFAGNIDAAQLQYDLDIQNNKDNNNVCPD